MMSSLPTLATSTSHLNAALLALANSRYTIYENTRMSGEYCTPHRMLPVDRRKNSSSKLEASYAHNMAKYFDEASVSTRSHSMPVSRQMDLLRQTLLLMAHGQHSIYDKTRISGENRTAHRMLPTYRYVERSDRCSDATDTSYANAMANYFVAKNISPL